MKHLTKIWSMALLLTATVFMVSCGEDDEPVIVVEDGLAVSDGYYFVQAGEDPVAEKALLPEKVEGEGFAAVDRDGFFGNYVFLEAGAYQLQKVESREVTSTIGGTLGAPELETDMGYLVAQTEENGSALDVATSGYYKVSFDETETELIMMEVTTVSVIGDATPNGWSSDTELDVKSPATDEGFVFEATGIEMRAGEFKIRINNRWTIDRRIERGDTPAGPTNGYVAFTNYGGSLDNLVAGGSNMQFDDTNEGIYTVSITLTNDGGAAFVADKTGDVQPITFVPEDNNWAVVGGATELGWPADGSCDEGLDMDMTYDGVIDGANTWSLELELTNDEFKFRKNDCWDGELGFGSLTFEGPDAANFSDAGGNIRNSTSGIYNVILSTMDDGDTYQVSFELLEETGGSTFNPEENRWAVVGGATSLGWPANNDCGAVDQDVDMTYDGIVEGAHTWSIEIPLTADAFKFRKNDCWDGDKGFGGIATITGADAGQISESDGNLLAGTAGTYQLKLATADDGATYSLDVVIMQ